MATLNRWQIKFGMMEVADAKWLKVQEKVNAELKKMYADAMLGMKIEAVSGNGARALLMK